MNYRIIHRLCNFPWEKNTRKESFLLDYKLVYKKKNDNEFILSLIQQIFMSTYLCKLPSSKAGDTVVQSVPAHSAPS